MVINTLTSQLGVKVGSWQKVIYAKSRVQFGNEWARRNRSTTPSTGSWDIVETGIH